MTDVEPGVTDFVSSGRAGRRNALPDILGSPAGVNSADLPNKLSELSINTGPCNICTMSYQTFCMNYLPAAIAPLMFDSNSIPLNVSAGITYNCQDIPELPDEGAEEKTSASEEPPKLQECEDKDNTS